jgi:phosphoribosyl 1,2-cyclic phosphate phosphodiesterase
MIQHGPIPCFGNSDTVERIKTIFNYIFNSRKAESLTPQLSIHAIDGPFRAGSVDVIPIKAMHGRASVLGFRIGGFAYMTDCSEIPPDSMKKLLSLDLLVLDALRFRSHPTHMNIDEAIEVVSKLAPKRTILTHLSHDIDYARDNPQLPEGMEFAVDGMMVDDIR